MKILAFVHNLYEDLELQYPKYRMIEAGYTFLVAGPEKGRIYNGKHGYPCKSDLMFSDVNPDEFGALVIPGGYAPDVLRQDPTILKITRSFHSQKKTIAFICHAGWIPVSAGIVRGFRCTSYVAIRDDLTNAGANWVDEPVVVDRNLISSRCPDDLPHFCQAILQSLPSAVTT